MNLWLAAGSLAAVLALAAIAWALGFGQREVGTRGEVADRFAQLLPGFTAESFWLAHDDKTALAIGRDCVALLRWHGGRFVALSLPHAALTRTGRDDFVVETGVRDWGQVRLALAEGAGDQLQSALDSLADNGVSIVRA